MMDKETQRTRGFGFVSFAEEDAAEKLIAIQPLEFEGKSVSQSVKDCKNSNANHFLFLLKCLFVRAHQSSFYPTLLSLLVFFPNQMEIKPAAPKHERDQAPAGSTILRRGGGSGGTTSGQTYDSRTGDGQDHRLPKGQSNNNNQNNFNGMNMMGGGMGMNMGMNPMGMMSGDGGNQFDPSMMARMFQQTGWGSQQWNPQMLWQMSNGMMNGMMNGMNGMGGMGMNMGMMGGGGYGNNMNMNMGNFGGASSPMGMMGGIGMQSPMNHQMNNQIGGSMSPPPQNQMQQQRQSNQNSSSSSQQQQQVNPNGRKRVDYSNLDNYQIKTHDNNNGNNNNNNHQNNRSGGMSTLPKAPSTLPPRPNTFIQDRSQSTSQQSDTVIDVMSRGRNSSSRSKSPETAKRLAGRDRERSPDSKRRNGNGDEEGGGGGRADRY